MVITAGSASGIAATARLTAVSSIRANGSPRAMPSAKIATQRTRHTTEIRLPKWVRRFCSGVLPSLSPESSVAIRPSSVCIPVPTTTPRPRP